MRRFIRESELPQRNLIEATASAFESGGYVFLPWRFDASGELWYCADDDGDEFAEDEDNG